MTGTEWEKVDCEETRGRASDSICRYSGQGEGSTFTNLQVSDLSSSITHEWKMLQAADRQAVKGSLRIQNQRGGRVRKQGMVNSVSRFQICRVKSMHQIDWFQFWTNQALLLGVRPIYLTSQILSSLNDKRDKITKTSLGSVKKKCNSQ